MTTTDQTPRSAAKKQGRHKMIRAGLASGLVLGVGAAVTLAAWSDSVWGAGTFGTSSFNIDGSFDGGATWSPYISSAEPGAMTFAQKSDFLIPNQPVYQLVGLHETEDDLGADVVLTRTNADLSALSDLVTVAVADLGKTEDDTAPACDGDADFAATATLGDEAAVMLTNDIDAGEYRWVCFSATLAANAPLDAGDVLSNPIVWEFAATSKDPA